MANQVAIQSFAYASSIYRQDVTTVATSDAAYVAVPQLFIPAGGAKTAQSSFCFKSGGVERFYRKGKTKVAITDAAYVAHPELFA